MAKLIGGTTTDDLVVESKLSAVAYVISLCTDDVCR